MDRKPRPSKSLLCAGLPETGKTTFLAALYHVVESGEVAGSLQIVDGALFENDRNYIQTQRERWIDFGKVERNKADVQGPILLTLTYAGARSDIRLDLPDLSGETFRQHVEERVVGKSFLERLARTSGVLLFINPDNVREPFTIAQADCALDAGNDEERQEGSASLPPHPESDDSVPLPDSPSDEDSTFDPRDCCTAVKLVDLLQLMSRGLQVAPLPVAIIVSAYDTLKNSPRYKDDPERYVREKLALLDQYLRANTDRYTHRIFGVSAQGGSYTNDAERSTMVSKELASERIEVRPIPATSRHDISYPIRWLSDRAAVEVLE